MLLSDYYMSGREPKDQPGEKPGKIIEGRAKMCKVASSTLPGGLRAEEKNEENTEIEVRLLAGHAGLPTCQPASSNIFFYFRARIPFGQLVGIGSNSSGPLLILLGWRLDR